MYSTATAALSTEHDELEVSMKTMKILALSALMVLVAVPFASAQIVWDSSFTVVNLSTTDATVSVTFYDDTGMEYTPDPLVPGEVTNPFTLPAGGSQIIVMAFASDTLPDGIYSVVLSADQPIVAIANLAGADGTIQYNGSYSGMEDVGQTSMYLPSVNKNFFGWNDTLSIQNLTNAAMDITVDFYAGTPTSIHQVTDNVPAFSSWHLDVSAESALPDDWNGSAVVSAAGPMAAVDNQINTVVGGATQDYSGIASGSTTVYLPGLYDQFFGWFSSLNVQNVGTVTTTVTVEYSDGAVESQDVGPNAAWLIVYGAGTHDTFFSAKVSASEPLVAIANANANTQSQTYEGFASGSMEIRTPLVMKEFVGAFNTGVQIQNVGASDATVTITYEGYESDAYSVTVPANDTYIFYTPGETFLPPGHSGAATITADQDIVGIVNQTNDNPGSATGDFSMSFDMFLVTP
jgi:hypothetical protein